MSAPTRFFRHLFTVLLAVTLLVFLSVAGLYLYLEPRLPAIDYLRDVHLQVPLRVFTRDGALIGEFGETETAFS